MRPTVFAPIFLVVFLAGSALAMGQDRNEQKINRLQRKIEKQSKKLQELTGEEIHTFTAIAPRMDTEEIEKIKKEAMAQADEARQEVQESLEAQREAIDAQREAMQEQKQDMEKKMIIIREKNAEKMEQLKDLNTDKMEAWKEVEVEKNINGKNYHYYYKSPNWKSKGGEAFIYGGTGDVKIHVPEVEGGAYSIFCSGQDNLSIKKALTDESSSADFNYEVKEGAGGMSVEVNGAIDSGKVTITIKRPDGEVYNEYTLSSLANVNWIQTVNFEDMEEAEYLGKWTVTVAAEKAKGNYSVQLSGR